MTIGVTEGQRTLDKSALHLRLDAVPGNVMLVRQALDGAARELGADTAIVDDLKLAVTEACSNVVKYAYRGEPGALDVSLDPVESGFVVIVQDNGSWLERASGDGEAGGLGIPLMEAVTRSLEIDSGDQGTTVRLEFALVREDTLDDELNESAERADA